MLSFVFGELERFLLLLLLRLRLMPSESVIILSYTAAGEDGESMGEQGDREEKREGEKEGGDIARGKDACCEREEGRGDNRVRARE